ncbi:high mobility group-T protein isoform X1 [Hetaerina americana]|uniref:high mobility group-T protein isoform X1 n=2 Tax=Hetaerina americana TaxID=62018 RepID=UPI003A7F32D9
MSEGQWGAREEAVWWPSAPVASGLPGVGATMAAGDGLTGPDSVVDFVGIGNEQAARDSLFYGKVPDRVDTGACASADQPPFAQVHGNGSAAYQPGNVPMMDALSATSTTQWWYPKTNPTMIRGRMPRAKAEAKPRGRMTAYAFFVQTCREEHKKRHPDENVVFAEFSRKCAERWKGMVDKEKKRFHEMADDDKKRYEAEMKDYKPPKGEKRGKKRKQFKDPNAPKRSLSAFFWFCNDERPKVKATNPEYGVGDIAKELGRKWSDADPDTKSKYEAMAEKDKARYDKEMTAYKKAKVLPASPVKGRAEAKKADSEDEDDDDDQEDGDDDDEDDDE